MGPDSSAGSAKPRRPWLGTVADFALVILGGLCALVAFGSAYGGLQYLLVGLVGLVVGSAVVFLGMRYRQPLVLVAAEVIAAYALVGSVLVIRAGGTSGGIPGPGNLATMATMTFSGWNGLLSTAPVVGDTGNLLVVPFLCATAAAAVTMGLARRVRTAWVAAIPLVVLLAVGILFGTAATPPRFESGGMLALVVLAWLAYRSRAQRVQGIGTASTTGPWRAAAILVVAAAVGLLIAPSVPGSSASVRYVLRDHVSLPFNALDYPSPLSAYRLYVLPKDKGGLKTTQLLKVDGAPAGSLLRLSTMDDYNGVVLNVAGGAQGSTASGNFATVGSPISPTTCYPEAPCRTATVSITDLHYTDVWLPDVGVVRNVEFAGTTADAQRGDFRYNTATDSAVLTSGLQPGDRYTMTVDVPTTTPDGRMQQAQPAQVSLPTSINVPGAVVKQSLALTTGATTGFAQAQDLQNKLRDQGAYSDGTTDQPDALSGHGSFRIQQFLGEPQPVGDAEQYATAMMLMARNLGLPARVVLGARLKPGSSVVTGSDITAWVEVKFQGTGWHPFFPTPKTDAPVRATPPPPSASSSNQAQNPNPPAPIDGSGSVSATARTKSIAHHAATPRVVQLLVEALKVLGAILLVLVIVLGPFVAIMWVKARRRKRRRTAARPCDRVSGGWQEVMDHAVDRGSALPPVATRNELAAVIGPSAVALAERADLSTFGPAETDDEAAAAFWTLVDDSLSEVDGTLSTWGRLKARINPRSLVAGRSSGAGSTIRQFIGQMTHQARRGTAVVVAKVRPGHQSGDA